MPLLAELKELPQSFFDASKFLSKQLVLQTDTNLTLREQISKNRDRTYEYDIFLSFSSKDIDWVRNLCNELRGYGLRVFFSDDNLRLHAGEPFLQTISNALINSKNFVLVCTPNAMESKYVRLEYETFHQECTMNDEENRLFLIYSGAKSFHKDLVPHIYRRLHYATSVDNLIKALAGKDSFVKTEPTINIVEQQRKAKIEAEERIIMMQQKAKQDEIDRINKQKQKDAQAEQSLWQSAFKANTLAAYQKYLDKYPKGQYAKEAAQFILILSPATVVEPQDRGTTITKTIQISKSNPSNSKKRIYYRIAAMLLIIIGTTVYVETRHEARLTSSEQITKDTNQSTPNENKQLTIKKTENPKQTEIKKGENKLSPTQLKAAGATVNPSNTNLKTGKFTDPRDGHTYKWVKIGNQTWMAENLAYKAASGCWAYENKESNANKYGYLYNWETAKTVAPAGWHLPSDEEWDVLTKYIERKKGTNEIGKYLKSTSGWDSNGNGNDYFGFGGLPAGYRGCNGTFGNVGDDSYWWGSAAKDASDAWHRYLGTGNAYWGRSNNSKECGFSVRVLRD